jgi:hypothetical protein
MFINLLATFAPLVLSSGSVLVMARAYTVRMSRWVGMWTIAVWCLCELSLGIAILLFLHALEQDDEVIRWTAYIGVPLVFILLACTSISLVFKAFVMATIFSLINFVVHYVVVGMALSVAGKSAALLVVVGSAWVCWTCMFSLSLMLHLRKRQMAPIGHVVMGRMRTDGVMEHIRQRKIVAV